MVHVVLNLCVKLSIIIQYALVQQIIPATHLVDVYLNVSVLFKNLKRDIFIWLECFTKINIFLQL